MGQACYGEAEDQDCGGALGNVNEKGKLCCLDYPVGALSSGISHKNFVSKTLCAKVRVVCFDKECFPSKTVTHTHTHIPNTVKITMFL